MDATFYDLIRQTLDSKEPTTLRMDVDFQCGVQKIIWSVWDHLVGPELKFIWNVNAKQKDEISSIPALSTVSDNCSSRNSRSLNEELGLNGDFENLSITADNDQKPDEVEDWAAEESKTDPCSRYATVYSLSSEIFKSHSSDNTEFKLICISDKNIAVASYIYSADHRSDDCHKSRFSICLILDEDRVPEFLKRKLFTDAFFEDTISRLKAASIIESDEDMLNRLSTYFVEYLSILSKLNSHLCLYLSSPFKISDTLLAKADLSKNQYLRQAITSHLQCKGYTVVLGSDLRVVNRMVRTLAFFEPADHLRMCLLASEDNTYCPYLKIQGLHKNELGFVVKHAKYSPWPVCLVDADSQTVLTTLPLKKHLTAKRKALEVDLHMILEPNVDTSLIFANFESTNTRDTIVADFLAQMDFLPYDDTIRLGFVSALNTALKFKSLALNAYVKYVSDRGRNRASLDLKDVVAAVSLENRDDFMIVLAVADFYQPFLAKFVLL